MRWIWLMAVAVGIAAGCHEKRDEARKEAVQVPAVAKEPVRTAVEDDDLRVMIAEIAAKRACEMIRGQFRPLRDPGRPGVVTGVLWINGCRIAQRGTKVTFHLAGDGWQWTDESISKAGGTFTVRDYVKFEMKVEIPGSLDTSYDQKSDVATVWFSPSKLPEVTFSPLGAIDVDRESTWATVVGGVGSVFGKSPERQADAQAEKTGGEQMQRQLGDGLSVTVDLCTGVQRFGLGRPGNGKMVPADIGETHAVSAELQPGGMMVFGPYVATRGLTAPMRATGGSVRAELMCHDDGEALAKAYAHGAPPPRVKVRATKMVRGEATLKAKAVRCPLVVVVHAVGASPVTIDWKRPPAEGSLGPLIHCDRD